jgi:hypothetical protein
MALLAWPIAFGLVLTLLTIFKQQLASMALAPRALVISAVLVSVMATVVMPLLTVAVSRGRIHAAPRVTPRARRRLAAALRRTADRLEPVARKAGLPHEQVRRIVQGDSVAPYFVTAERQGVCPSRCSSSFKRLRSVRPANSPAGLPSASGTASSRPRGSAVPPGRCRPFLRRASTTLISDPRSATVAGGRGGSIVTPRRPPAQRGSPTTPR